MLQQINIDFLASISKCLFQKGDILTQLISETSVWYAWVGAHDNQTFDEFTFVGSGRHVPSGMWAESEPNHSRGDCVMLDSVSGRLTVLDCASTGYFICEFFH